MPAEPWIPQAAGSMKIPISLSFPAVSVRAFIWQWLWRTRTIFMDEPTTYLDISHQFRLMETAKSLAREGKAVVLVLHDISLALREADVIAVFQDGRLLCCDTPEIVYQKGVMEEVFGVGIHRMDTPHGIQYYCTPKEV